MYVKVAISTKRYEKFAKEIRNVVSINSKICKATATTSTTTKTATTKPYYMNFNQYANSQDGKINK